MSTDIPFFQALLDKIAESKLPYALKALFDAMKFKYKKLYDHVMAVRKQTYKEGVVTTIGKPILHVHAHILTNDVKFEGSLFRVVLNRFCRSSMEPCSGHRLSMS